MMRGMRARPKTLIQPNAAARLGANSAASTVPELPAPAMPSAVPWCSGGYHRDASGSATAKDDAGQKNPGEAVDTVEPDCKEADEHDHLRDQPGAPRLEVIDQHAEEH